MRKPLKLHIYKQAQRVRKNSMANLINFQMVYFHALIAIVIDLM